MVTLACKVFETIPGSWAVGGVAVSLYRSGQWRCGVHGWQAPTDKPCEHVALVEQHPSVTRCEWAREIAPDGFEKDCGEIACDSVRVEGAPTALCPRHLYQLSKAN